MYRRDIYEQDKKPVILPDRSNRVILSINDDFKFCYRFLNNNELNTDISLANLNIKIKYFIKGREEYYLVKKYKTDLLNCILIDDQKVLKAIIEKPGLGEGDLFAEFNLYFDDFEFADTVAISQYVVDTRVTLVDPVKITELKTYAAPKLSNALIAFDEETGEVYGTGFPNNTANSSINKRTGEVYSDFNLG